MYSILLSNTVYLLDTSEHESRVQALRDSLDDRRRIAQKLKVEYKRRVKERLENTEKSLLNQLKVTRDLEILYFCNDSYFVGL